jgi:hypothetical protein
LNAAALLQAVKNAGAQLTLNGASLLLDTDGEPPPDLVAGLRVHKAELVALLKGEVCHYCGERMDWPRPVGVAFADGTAAHHACYQATGAREP